MPFPLDHIVIYAADAAASGSFYSCLLDALGFERRRDGVFARDGFFLDIREMLNDSPARERGQRGVDHIGFKATSRGEVDAIDQVMRSAGFNGRLIEFDGGDYALFLPDPDGVRIEITCYSDPSGDPVD